MMNNLRCKLISCVAAGIIFFVGGCKENNEPFVPEEGDVKTTVLLYAVASNNLYGNLLSDKKEILKAARDIDLAHNSFYLYEVTPDEMPQMLKLTQVSPDSCAFVAVKKYTKELYSTDPERITEVIDDMHAMQKSERYGLILWSHGTGVDPATSQRRVSEKGSGNPVLRSFGSDCDKDKDSGYKDETDIDELADAIPDGLFDFIWFDACYMSGIETAYELRGKCNYLVGYPTEVFTPGMPYDLTVPYILNENPDLCGAAKAFFNHYVQYPSSSWRVATIAVTDMSKIEQVAEYCRNAYSEMAVPDVSSLQKYTRGRIGPFYDFGQYTRLAAAGSETAPSVEEFDAMMDSFVIYKAATDVDFNYAPIRQEHYSGLSCYAYSEYDETAKGRFYRTLDWYKSVYEKAN